MNPTHPVYHYAAGIDDDRKSVQEILRVVLKAFQPQSLADFGCGLGHFVSAAQQAGVARVLGLDGTWAQSDPLFSIGDPGSFQAVDLTQPIHLQQRYDVALCLEVAEHLPASAADTLVENLTRASDIIVFSAAIPGQGGVNHINEQWLPYWQQKFVARGFEGYDLFRPIFWNNDDVQWWYRQNLYLFVSKGKPFDPSFLHSLRSEESINQVHPGQLASKNREMEKFFSGGEGITTYARCLWKAVRRKVRK